MKKIILLLLTLTFTTAAYAQWTQQTLTATNWAVQTNAVTSDYQTVKVVSASVVWALGGTAAAAPAKVARSTDGGVTWTNATGNLPTTLGPGALDAVSDSVAWFGSDAGTIYGTTNAGTNWTLQYPATNPASFIDGIKFFNKNLGYAVGDPPGSASGTGAAWLLLKTTNGGANWNPLPTLASGSGTEAGWNNSFFWTDSLRGWFGTNNSRIYRTTNGGQNWTYAATSAANAYAIAFSTPATGVAVFSTSPWAAATADSGKTWTAVPTTSGLAAISFGLATAGGNTYFANTQTQLLKTTNAGTNWTVETTVAGTGHVNFLNATTGFFLGTGGQTLQYTPTTAGLFYGVKAPSTTVAWAGGAAGTYARTTNGGTTWTLASVPGASSLAFYAVAAFDANTAYLLGTGTNLSNIYKTTNGGTTWTQQYSNSTTGIFFDGMAFWDANNGVAYSDAVSGSFVIVTTTNGGTNWTQVPSANIPAALSGEGGYSNGGASLAVAGSSTAWFVTAGGSSTRIFKTTNKGTNWTVTTTPLSAGLGIGVAFRDTLNGYAIAAAATSNIAKTTDGGSTWTLVTNSQPSGSKSAITYVPGTANPTLVVVGTGSGYSLNDGATWTSINTATYTGVSFAAANSGYATGGTAGQIFKYSVTVSAPERTSPVADKFTLSQNYPNPFNPTTSINYTLASSGKVSLKVYDVLGREVATLVNDVQQAGTYTARFDATKFSSGVYFYKLQAGNFVETKKMMLVK